MNYKIAELKVNIPDVGDLKEKCKAYEDVDYLEDMQDKNESASNLKETQKLHEYAEISAEKCDITITAEEIRDVLSRDETLTYDEKVYLTSGSIFYRKILKFNGMMLHASAIKMDGEVYLFSGPSEVGKSTHANLWKQHFKDAVVINDDKPALRLIDGKWIAYGTPWCGKDYINVNDSAPVKAICFLKQGEKNEIRKLEPIESIPLFIEQTIYRLGPKRMNKMLELLDDILRKIPVYELTSKADMEAVSISAKAMMDGETIAL